MRRRLFTILSAVSLVAFLIYVGHRYLWMSLDAFYNHAPANWTTFSASALFLIAPGFWIAMTINRRRNPPHKDASKCEVCGYDLRATPGRCPECGATPAKD